MGYGYDYPLLCSSPFLLWLKVKINQSRWSTTLVTGFQILNCKKKLYIWAVWNRTQFLTLINWLTRKTASNLWSLIRKANCSFLHRCLIEIWVGRSGLINQRWFFCLFALPLYTYKLLQECLFILTNSYNKASSCLNVSMLALQDGFFLFTSSYAMISTSTDLLISLHNGLLKLFNWLGNNRRMTINQPFLDHPSGMLICDYRQSF